ncbi:2-dehydropantoate 2-reductase [Paraburkholderia phosphatilytica]|uniref:2-dehydropantoate 2-reductase n=1 Tax=Paraburkholderia phosphatilytica TaxID=2282883 RepID=UPI000E4FEF2B|nr:2-dehydropantoate 2-reductase [Paraburkholderia phosphatilytica]
MRILVVGAGAVGGYFGGRLAAAGRDVAFLVRKARAAQLRDAGLVIRSPRGDVTLRDVKTVDAASIDGPYDLVLLSCKAYSLDDAIESFAPAVGPGTLILPLLNGMRHLDVLTEKFGAAHVLGGQCIIVATLNERKDIVHMNEVASMTFGALEGGIDERVQAIAAELSNRGFDVYPDENVRQQMWEKWVFLATLAASTSLCRAAVGDILSAPDGKRLIEGIFAECGEIAKQNGHPIGEGLVSRAAATFFVPGSPLTASMLRDIMNGAPIEADHVIGDLIARGGPQQHDDATLSLLRVAYTHLKAYEARQAKTPA